MGVVLIIIVTAIIITYQPSHPIPKPSFPQCNPVRKIHHMQNLTKVLTSLLYSEPGKQDHAPDLSISQNYGFLDIDHRCLDFGIYALVRGWETSHCLRGLFDRHILDAVRVFFQILGSTVVDKI